MIVRAALTQTVNAFTPMPDDLSELADRLDEVRDANLAHNIELVKAAAQVGARVICLGELFAGPYFALEQNDLWFGLAEDATNGPSVTAMRECARREGIFVIAPIYETAGVHRFNAAVLIDDTGAILGKYRKAHIPNGRNERAAFFETFYYSESDGDLGPSPCNISSNRFFPVFDTTAGRIGIEICYDRHFEGVTRTLAAHGAQLVFCPAVTFGRQSHRMWHLEFAVDAARHRVFIGGGNRKGREAPWGVNYFGESYFVGPNGCPPAIACRPELVIADLDLTTLEDDGSGWQLGRDRRPEIY